MTSVLFTYRVDQEDALYHAKLVTDASLPTHGRFLSDYVCSVVSYGLEKYREKQGLSTMTTGIRLGTLYPATVKTAMLTVDDQVDHDFCFLSKDNQGTYYIDGEELLL